MSLKDIEKLKERVDKDPNSKLFVPLAEEYRKEGMLDEAISVLMGGIERQPGYMSARVSLGKIFLEKGMTNEARGEFENVIKSIPDNLYAHKKLAEIYRDMGRKDLSVQSYRTVLKLNPLDEDALSNLRDLEEEELRGPGKVPAMHEESAAVEEAEAEPVEEAIAEEDATAEAVEVPAEIDADDLSAFKDSLFGDKAAGEEAVDVLEATGFETTEAGEDAFAYEPSENKEEPVEVVEEAFAEEEPLEVVEEPAEEEAFEIAEELPETDAEMSFADVEEPAEEEAFAVAEEPAEEEAFEIAEELPETDAEMSFADVDADIEEAPSPPVPEPEEAMSFGDIETAEAARETASEQASGEQTLLADADRFVAEGDYVRAIQAYRAILSSDPDNRMILQRVEELRTLLKLMGKDKDALIARLNTFLEGISKRRNEFYGRS